MTDVKPVVADAKTVDVSAKRLPGARWVAFLARGPSGLFAQPVTFDAGLFPGARRRVHIVSVGIDHYYDDRIQQLHFAGSDAARFLKTLQDKAGTSVEIVSHSCVTGRRAAKRSSPNSTKPSPKPSPATASSCSSPVMACGHR